MNAITTSVYFGALLSIAAYLLGMWISKRFRIGGLPLLIAIVVTIAVLLIFKIDYSTYNEGAKYISYLLTPATVSLAIPLYMQFEQLKKNCFAILAGICSGVLTSLFSVLGICALFRLSHEEYLTFLPKSITSAIGMAVSEELGGYVSITVAVIILTGLLGNMFAWVFIKIFNIKDPVARGVAIGTSSHAIGTARAMEIGDVEGAMSSLSIVIAGLLTVILSPIFAGFY